VQNSLTFHKTTLRSYSTEALRQKGPENRFPGEKGNITTTTEKEINWLQKLGVKEKSRKGEGEKRGGNC